MFTRNFSSQDFPFHHLRSTLKKLLQCFKTYIVKSYCVSRCPPNKIDSRVSCSNAEVKVLLMGTKHSTRAEKEGKNHSNSAQEADAIAGLPSGPSVIWEDKFSSGLSSNCWECQSGNGHDYQIPGWGNKEQQWYSPENAEIIDNQLAIHVTKHGTKYQSAKLTTKGMCDFCPGDSAPNGIRIEASIQLPQGGQGIWPAFWMLPSEGPAFTSGKGVYGYWPMSGEIDIMEAVNDMTLTHSALHYGGPENMHAMISSSAINQRRKKLKKGFHTFTVEWRRESMVFLVDNHVILEAKSGGHTLGGWFTTNGAKSMLKSSHAPFDRPFHIILNVAVGGTWPGNPTSTTPFPQIMLVDCVRVIRL